MGRKHNIEEHAIILFPVGNIFLLVPQRHPAMMAGEHDEQLYSINIRRLLIFTRPAASNARAREGERGISRSPVAPTARSPEKTGCMSNAGSTSKQKFLSYEVLILNLQCCNY